LQGSSTCNVCHDWGAGFDYLWYLNDVRLAYEAGLVALEAQLEAKGYYFRQCHPYFYNEACECVSTGDPDDPGIPNCIRTSKTVTGNDVRDWMSPGDLGPGDTIVDTAKHNMGAAFNFNMLKHDPGAFAHHSFYTKWLVYDSLDWLDDNSLGNDWVANTLPTLGLGSTVENRVVEFFWWGERP
jgi:hypothetical protein